MITSGASTAVEHLLHVICDASDGILVPTPNYHMFAKVATHRNDLKFIPVPTESNDLDAFPNSFSVENFRTVLNKATSDGIPVKAILLSHPASPLGRVFTETQMDSFVSFCVEKNLAIISDEIFMATTFEGKHQNSILNSVLRIGEEAFKRVFVVSGFAKLGMAGYKIGFTYTTNTEVRQVLRKMAMFAQVSSDTQGNKKKT